MPRPTAPAALYAVIAIEDDAVSFLLRRHTPSGIEPAGGCRLELNLGASGKAVVEEAKLTKFVRDQLSRLLPKRAPKLAGVGISAPGIIDTKAITVSDRARDRVEHTEAVHPTALLRFRPAFAEWINAATEIVADNDAIMSALGERWHRLGTRPATIEDDFAYIRAGAGINAAAFVNRTPIVGAAFVSTPFTKLAKQHPEMGHIIVRRHRNEPLNEDGKPVRSICKMHGEPCLEGMAGSERLRELARHLGQGEADRIAGYYIAQLCNALALMLAPRRILLAGTTVEDAHARGGSLLDDIRGEFASMTQNYPHFGKPESYIVKAELSAAEASWRGALWATMKAKHDRSIANSSPR